MYVAPPAASASLIAGSSHLAQRSSWKLFHETPTVQPACLEGAACIGPGRPPRSRTAPSAAGKNLAARCFARTCVCNRCDMADRYPPERKVLRRLHARGGREKPGVL